MISDGGNWRILIIKGEVADANSDHFFGISFNDVKNWRFREPFSDFGRFQKMLVVFRVTDKTNSSIVL